jgi:Transglutaminase-like superfamily
VIRKAFLGLEAAVVLGAAELALRAVPCRRLTRLLGFAVPAVDDDARGRIDPAAQRVGRAVERVAGVLPWRPACLPQAIATRAMLRRRGIPCEGHLGVVSTDPFEAHAWITVNGWVVQGGPVHDAAEIAAFR